jgi:hypothetical protein
VLGSDKGFAVVTLGAHPVRPVFYVRSHRVKGACGVAPQAAREPSGLPLTRHHRPQCGWGSRCWEEWLRPFSASPSPLCDGSASPSLASSGGRQFQRLASFGGSPASAGHQLPRVASFGGFGCLASPLPAGSGCSATAVADCSLVPTARQLEQARVRCFASLLRLAGVFRYPAYCCWPARAPGFAVAGRSVHRRVNRFEVAVPSISGGRRFRCRRRRRRSRCGDLPRRR